VGKLILMCVVLATAIIPASCARDPSARRGLRRTIYGLLIFNFIYGLLLIFVFPHLAW
jgi:hypothetical protein